MPDEMSDHEKRIRAERYTLLGNALTALDDLHEYLAGHGWASQAREMEPWLDRLEALTWSERLG
jgi:hypothetical protein